MEGEGEDGDGTLLVVRVETPVGLDDSHEGSEGCGTRRGRRKRNDASSSSSSKVKERFVVEIQKLTISLTFEPPSALLLLLLLLPVSHLDTHRTPLMTAKSAARGGITSHPDLLSVNFNQDASCISTGTRKGYTITNCDPFGKVYGKSEYTVREEGESRGGGDTFEWGLGRWCASEGETGAARGVGRRPGGAEECMDTWEGRHGKGIRAREREGVRSSLGPSRVGCGGRRGVEWDSA